MLQGFALNLILAFFSSCLREVHKKNDKYINLMKKKIDKTSSNIYFFNSIIEVFQVNFQVI